MDKSCTYSHRAGWGTAEPEPRTVVSLSRGLTNQQQLGFVYSYWGLGKHFWRDMRQGNQLRDYFHGQGEKY